MRVTGSQHWIKQARPADIYEAMGPEDRAYFNERGWVITGNMLLPVPPDDKRHLRFEAGQWTLGATSPRWYPAIWFPSPITAYVYGETCNWGKD